MLNLDQQTRSGVVILVWSFLPAQQDFGQIMLTVPYICHSFLLKGSFMFLCCQCSYPLTPLFDLDKRVFIPYVPQPTCIVHVSDSSLLSHYITTIYSRMSKETLQLVFLVKYSFNKQQYYLFCVYPHPTSTETLMHMLHFWGLCIE